jgi:hypothetical protein
MENILTEQFVSIIRIILVISQVIFLLGIVITIVSIGASFSHCEPICGSVWTKLFVNLAGSLMIPILTDALAKIAEPIPETETTAFDWSLITNFFGKYVWIFIAILFVGVAVGTTLAVIRYRKSAEIAKVAKQREVDETALQEKLATLTENLEIIHEIQDSKPIPEKIIKQLNQLETIAIAIKQAVTNRPEYTREIRQFLNYHVPTTTNLLIEYHKVRLTPDSLHGVPNAAAILSGIENHMETSVRIYHDVYNEMLQSRFYRVQTEIHVSKIME